MTQNPILTRRGLIVAGGATVAGASALALAACSPAGGGQPAAPDASAEPGLQPGTELAKLSDVPVGGSIGVKVDGSDVVLAQPVAGSAVAFSAICQHQGCVVAAAGGEFDCPCHGSRYDAATGAVLNGPSTRPLIEITVAVEGDSIVVA